MNEPLHMPSPEHEQFDEICSRVADFDLLPVGASEPTPQELESEDEPLDGLILAGLVSPY
jgi:hypothetical protein